MTTMSTQEIQAKLTELFIRAEMAALAADPGPGPEHDGGTCNLDSPAFRVDRLRQSVIEAAAKDADLSVTDFTWFRGQRWFWLRTTTNGMANRRSTMAEAADKVLRAAQEANEIPGFHACLYCQAD